MPHFYRNKFNNSITKRHLGSMKTEEEKDKEKNMTIIKDKDLPKEPVKTEPPKIERQNATVNNVVNSKISKEKLKKFINFKI